MHYSTLEQNVSNIITPVIEGLGFELLWVEFKGGALQIFAENPKTQKLNLEECTQISREISPVLEVEDPIESRYRLEVSSPGLDRPLFKASDYERYAGLGVELKVELENDLEGQRKFRGFLEKADESEIVLKTDHGEVELPFNNIYKAKLVMTDALIKATKKFFETANENKADQNEVTSNNAVDGLPS